MSEPNPWAGPDTSLQGRYDDDRLLILEPSFNDEVAVRVGDQDPVFVDALDLLRITSHTVLGLVYDPSPSEKPRYAVVDPQLPLTQEVTQ